MADEAYTFDEQGARRIVAAVRKVEGTPPPLGPSGMGGRTSGSNIQRLRICSSDVAEAEDDSRSFYSAVRREIDPDTGDWRDAEGPDTLWVFDPEGATFSEDDKLWGRQVGSVSAAISPDDPEERPTFAAVTAGPGSGADDCDATCFDNIRPESLGGTLDPDACEFTEEHDDDQYCGPVCVSNEECPEEADACTACVGIYKSKTDTDTSALVVDWDGDECKGDLTGTPKRYLYGCFTVSDTPTPNSIAVISTTDPFCFTIDPDDCDATPVYTYTLKYISGAFVRLSDPETVALFNSSNAIIPALVPNSTTPSAAAANTAAMTAAVDSGLKEISLRAGKMTLASPIMLGPSDSGLKINGAGAGVPVNYTETDGTTWLTTGGGFPKSFGLGDQDAPEPTSLGYLSTFGATDSTHIYIGEFADQFQVGDAVFLGHFNATEFRDTKQQTVTITAITADTPNPGQTTLTITPALNTANDYSPLDLTKTISNVARTSNVVTITTSTAHTFATGQAVTLSGLSGAGAPLNGGPYTLTGTPLTTTFTFTLAGSNIGSAADSGSAFRQGGGNHKYARFSRLVDSISSDIITLVDATSTELFKIGHVVAICDGFAIQDAWAEFVTVIETADSPGTALTAGQVLVSPPPRRTFVDGRTALVPGGWIEDVTLERLFLDYVYGRGCVNLKLIECYFSAFAFNVAASVRTTFIRCGGFFQLNSNQDTLLDDCNIFVFAFEESNASITIKNSRLYRAMITSFDTNYVTLENNDIYWDQRGGGFGGSFVQFNSGLNTDYVRLIGNRFWSNSFPCTILGNNATVTGNYIHTGQSIVMDGLNHLVEGNYGPGEIVLAAGSTGKLRGNTCTITDSSPGLWSIEHSTDTAFVTDQVVNDDRLSVFRRDGTFVNYLPVVGLVPMDVYFPLDEAGGAANDASGNGHPLAQYGYCPVAVGKFGYCRSFPTSADGLLAAYTDIFGTHALYPTAFGIAAGEYLTVRVLIKVIDEDAGGTICGLWQNNNQWILQHDGGDQTIIFAVNGGAFAYVFHSSATITEDDAWHYLLLEIDDVGKTITLTVDGGTPQVESYAGTIGAAADIFAIGNDGYLANPFLSGYIDDFRLDKRQWTAAEKLADYNGGDFAPPPIHFGDFQPLAVNLTALSVHSGSGGMLTITGTDIGTGANTYAVRSLATSGAGLSVSNANGASGDPTLSLADDLAALEALSGTDTIYRRSGSNTWAAVTIGTGLVFSGGTLAATSVVLFHDITDASSTSTNGSTEDDLFSHTIAADTLSANGGSIVARCTVTFVGHATATRRVKVYVAGIGIFDSGATAYATTTAVKIEVEIMRVSSSTAEGTVTFTPSGVIPLVTYVAPATLAGLDFTTTNVFKYVMMAGGVGAASGDIIGRHNKVHFFPPAP